MNVLAWIEQHPGLAAWLQAIGTLAALGIAIGIPIADRKRLERASAFAMKTLLTRAMDTGEHAQAYLRRERAETPEKDRVLKDLQVVDDALASFPLANLPPAAAPLFQRLREDLDGLRGLVQYGEVGTPEMHVSAAAQMNAVYGDLRALWRAAPGAGDKALLAHVQNKQANL